MHMPEFDSDSFLCQDIRSFSFKDKNVDGWRRIALDLLISMGTEFTFLKESLSLDELYVMNE